MGVQPGSLEVGADRRDAVDRHDSSDLDDHLAESRRNARRGQSRRRSPARRPTPAAASWPGSKSRPTTARPGTRRRSRRPTNRRSAGPTRGRPTTGPHDDQIAGRGRQQQPRDPIGGRVGQRRLPVLDLGHRSPPRRRSSSDPNSITVGVKFTAEVGGTVIGSPLLQGDHRHRHPRRQPVERERDPAGVGHVHERNRLGLAAGQLLETGDASPPAPPTSRRTSRRPGHYERRPTTSTRPPAKAGRSSTARPCTRSRPPPNRSEGRSAPPTASVRLRRRQRVPHQQRRRDQLLGRRRVRTGTARRPRVR